ncbi:MAG: sulfatase [bacterium]
MKKADDEQAAKLDFSDAVPWPAFRGMLAKTGEAMKKISVCIILSAACVFCHAGDSDSDGNPQLNVVLVSLNALRADHLKAYGYGTETAPNISRLAGESAVFEHAVAQSHWTLPSLASLFTSRYVHSHGVYERGGKVSEKELALAEILKKHGYRTAAFTGGLDMIGQYGLNQGFDVYSDETDNKPMGTLRDIMPRALKWLAGSRDEKFFLFIDAYDIHPPFDRPEPGSNDPGYSGVLKGLLLDYNLLRDFKNGVLFLNGKEVRLTKDDIDYINSRYDAGIAYADRFIGELLARIDELKLSEKTIIIFTAEHGEELADHGSFDRFGRKNLYDEAIRVPLFIKSPHMKLKGTRVMVQAQLIDIMPTVLDLLGIPVNNEAQGVSLVPVIEDGKTGKDFSRHGYSEASFHKWAMRTGKWKLICENGRYELYDLLRDKAELNNLAVAKPSVVYELVQKLLEWRRKTRTDKSPDDTKIVLTDEMKSKLKEAGYWR